MSKIPIDEQIETVREASTWGGSDISERLRAAVRTLEFVRDHQEEIRYARS